MADMQMWFLGSKVRKAQMNLATYGMVFLMVVAIIMMALLYFAFTESV